MTLAAAVLLGACVGAEVAALGLAVVVVVRRGSSFRTSNEAAKQEPAEHENRRGLFQSFASPRFRSLSGKLRNFASSPWFRAIAALGCRIGAWLRRAASVAGLGNFSRAWQQIRKLATNGAKSYLVRLLAFAVLADALGAVCSLVADMGPRPRVGWHRVAYHLADALVMAWPVAACWAARAMFGATKGERPELERGPSRSRWLWCAPRDSATDAVPPAREAGRRHGRTTLHRALALVNGSGATLPAVVSFSLGTLALVLGHPVPRVWTQRTLHAHELLCVAVTWWAVWRGRSLAWRVEHRALVVLASFEAVVATVGPFAGDVFERWPVVGAVLYFAAFSTVAVLLGWELRVR